MFLLGNGERSNIVVQLVAELVLGKIQLSVVFSGAPETLAYHWLLTGSISPRMFYICCIHPPCNRGIAIFSHDGSYNFSCFQEGCIPLALHLNYFFFFLVTITRSYISLMILLAVCTCNFFQAVLLHVVRVLFIESGSCLSSSTGFPEESVFLAFEAPLRCWDVLLDSLKIANLHLLGSTGLVQS